MQKTSEGLHAQFYLNTVKDEEATQREGRPIFKEVPFVKIFIPGDATLAIDQPAWIDDAHPYSHTNRFKEQWQAFQAGQKTEQRTGTPLELMPGISKPQVRELEHFHVHTVEQLASMADGNAMRFAGVIKLRDEAKAYLERAAGAAPEKRLRAELAERDEKLALLQQQMAELLAAKQASNPKQMRKE